MQEKHRVPIPTCKDCRYFCPSQLYINKGYCSRVNGKSEKVLISKDKEACEAFSATDKRENYKVVEEICRSLERTP